MRSFWVVHRQGFRRFSDVNDAEGENHFLMITLRHEVSLLSAGSGLLSNPD